MEKDNESLLDRDIQDFQANMCPFGYMDIKKMIQTAKDAGKDYMYCVDAIQNYIDNVPVSLDQIDPVYCIFDALHQEARTDIERLTGKDICNDEPYFNINIHANYMCTSFDGSEENNKALHDLINTIPENDQTEVIKWLKSEIEY